MLTGTNGFYVTNWLQTLGGTITVDTKSIAEMSGTTLFDGIYEAQGPGAVINLGGALQHLIVNIATIEGPPSIPDGWTELLLNGPNARIQEWNGSGYVGIETTLKDIENRGAFDVLAGRDYATANTLTVGTGGMLDLQAGTVTTAGLNINGGIVQGFARVAGGVLNNGTLMAVGGTLDVLGGLTGTGVAMFDYDQRLLAHAATGSTLEVHGVSAGQTILMNGDDTLQLDTPAAFAGTVSAKPGDKIVLQGVTATTAAVTGGTLVLSNGAQVVGALALAGAYGGESFNPVVTSGGTTLTIAATPPDPANYVVVDTTTQTITTAAGTAYAGPVAGVQHQYVNITTDNLNITAAVPNSFIHAGSGNDTIDVSKVGGTNLLDASTGSEVLIGGSGKDNFFIDDQVATVASWSSLVNFHAGDAVTIWGLTPADFTLDWQDNQGAFGLSGLTLHATAAGKSEASMTLVGYTTADLVNGRLSVSFGGTQAAGNSYMSVHGA